MIVKDRPVIEGETTLDPGLYKHPKKVWVTREGTLYGMKRLKPAVHVLCAFTMQATAWEFSQSVLPSRPYMVVEQVTFDEALDIARAKHLEFSFIVGVMVDLDPEQVVYVA